MTGQIDAVLFDLGGTLRRTVRRDWEDGKGYIQRLLHLLGSDAAAEEFARLLKTRSAAYLQWARETEQELDEGELWTRWMLPEWPSSRIRPLAVQLNQLWREAWSRKEILPEAPQAIISLFRRGYRLGLVSNTASSVEAPQALKEMAVSGCFEVVLLSCTTGTRKPNPAMLLQAAAQMEVEPGRCAYVGDRLDRDVAAARRAGFGLAVILGSPSTPAHRPVNDPALAPDEYIDTLLELLEFFPARRQPDGQPVRASLSTMWAKQNFPTLEDFATAGRRMGFVQVELNHEINSALLGGIDLGAWSFSSVHEPCPADIATAELKRNDWLVSSPDGEKRARGVESVKRSIDLAQQVGASLVVVHAGQVSSDLGQEKQLRALIEAGKGETGDAAGLRAAMVRARQESSAPHLEAVKQSLRELVDYAAQRQVRLGLENRYHYPDIPHPDEMAALLELGAPDQLGMVFDAGHAHVLERMGFFAFEEWLERFGNRIAAVHLHDVNGLADHAAPGTGEINFSLLASYLPEEAVRTFEIKSGVSYAQIRRALQWMVRSGWLEPLET